MTGFAEFVVSLRYFPNNFFNFVFNLHSSKNFFFLHSGVVLFHLQPHPPFFFFLNNMGHACGYSMYDGNNLIFL